MSGEVSAAVDGALQAVATQADAMLFGVDRSALSSFEVRSTGVYLRELRKMTAEEIESAVIGFHCAAWENWPDEPAKVIGDPNVPGGRAYLVGLSDWLPTR